MAKRAAVAAISLAVATPSFACSMASGYRVPTNLELAAAADTIVVATVENARSGDWVSDGVVMTRPTLLLKGEKLPPTVEIEGAILDNDFPRPATRSRQAELRKPNPDAMIGGCVRYVFAKDMKLVLFLKRDDQGRLAPYRSSFSRDAEDVQSDDALWVKAAREYGVISLRPRTEWKPLLKQRIAELTAAGDPESLAIARDMKVELSGKRTPPVD